LILCSTKTQVTTTNNAVTAVKFGAKMLLQCFLSYVSHCYSEGIPINDNWDQVQQSEFDAQHIDPMCLAPIIPPRASVPSSTVAANTVGNTGFVPQYSPADMFCCGIKRYCTWFPILKMRSSMRIGPVLLSTRQGHKV
jgi:hypothetical protein